MRFVKSSTSFIFTCRIAAVVGERLGQYSVAPTAEEAPDLEQRWGQEVNVLLRSISSLSHSNTVPYLE